LTVNGTDLKGRRGQYQIDAQTGEATLTLTSDRGSAAVQSSPDGKKVYYQKNYGYETGTGSDRSFVERDIASGTERQIIRRPVRDNAGATFALNLSPDGRFIATTSNDESTKSSVVLLVPVSGGEPRELLRVSQPQVFTATASWMPDGRAVLVIKSLNFGWPGIGNELWIVPIDGSQPRKIDLGTTTGLGPAVRVHPDGRQIAYAVGEGEKSEVWALENFLPALNAKK
jgi:Tol biopolymer transport system component